jgi:four helix bundle protein
MTTETKDEGSRSKEKSFENPRVFADARILANRIFDLTSSPEFTKEFALVNQMRGAAVSILSNIAEGFERETDPEFARFLYMAKGSCGELRAQILLCGDRGLISKKEQSEVTDLCRTVSKRLFRLIEYLKHGRKPQPNS